MSRRRPGLRELDVSALASLATAHDAVALAAGLEVHFADGELGELQRAICALSGKAGR